MQHREHDDNGKHKGHDKEPKDDKEAPDFGTFGTEDPLSDDGSESGGGGTKNPKDPGK